VVDSGTTRNIKSSDGSGSFEVADTPARRTPGAAVTTNPSVAEWFTSRDSSA
jgi:hypothetical protein